MVKKIRLAPDYGSSGMWWIERDDGRPAGGMIALHALPLSEATKQRLAAWIAHYEEQMDWDDPGHSPPPTEEWKRTFEREAHFLWHQIQHELGPEYEVYYGDLTIADHPQRR